MAEDLKDAASAAAAADAAREGVPQPSEPLVRPLPERRVAHRMRFAAAYLALAAVAGGALGAAIVLFNRPAESSAAWSAWQPPGADEGQYPTEIARHVAARYRDAEDRHLVTVIAGPPEIQGERLLGVAVEADTGRAEDAAFDALGTSVMYQMCGGTQSCAFPDGNLDIPRLRLLRRESLELALYSFKYVDGLESVITLLPPDPDESTEGAATTIALYFRRNDLRAQLGRPLGQTLAENTITRLGGTASRDSQLVEQLTSRRTFAYNFTRVQTGSPILLLKPLEQITRE